MNGTRKDPYDIENRSKLTEYLDLVEARVLRPLSSEAVQQSCSTTLLLVFATIDALGKLTHTDARAPAGVRFREFLGFLGQGRSVAQSGHPGKAQRTARGSTGDAQAHPAGARRFIRRLRQSSQCREGGCAVGRLYAGRSQQPPAQKSWHRGELFPSAGRGTIGSAIRY
jgi:hypothetical protein